MWVCFKRRSVRRRTGVRFGFRSTGPEEVARPVVVDKVAPESLEGVALGRVVFFRAGGAVRHRDRDAGTSSDIACRKKRRPMRIAVRGRRTSEKRRVNRSGGLVRFFLAGCGDRRGGLRFLTADLFFMFEFLGAHVLAKRVNDPSREADGHKHTRQPCSRSFELWFGYHKRLRVMRTQVITDANHSSRTRRRNASRARMPGDHGMRSRGLVLAALRLANASCALPTKALLL